MSRPTPSQDLKNLSWSTEWPDQEGYWWFTYNNGRDGFVARIHDYDLREMKTEGQFLLLALSITPRMNRDRWIREKWQCCPVVLP